MTLSAATVLIILDGWGHRDAHEDNAIALANTPNWDRLWRTQARTQFRTLISASGPDVGLPEGQMGNSEVGHMNLGAGRVIHQDLTRIGLAIADGSFHRDSTLSDMMLRVVQSGGALHIFGLLSNGGVHSHEDHIMAAISSARTRGVTTIYLHAFLDGRDVPPKSAEKSLIAMHDHIRDGGAGAIASIIGRYYAMDRDNRWDRIQQAYELVTDGKAQFNAKTPSDGLKLAYARGETDEFVKATSISGDANMPTRINDGDAILFMNFRSDRARQLTRSFVEPEFSDFERGRLPKIDRFVTLTSYAADIGTSVIFAPQSIANTLGEYVSAKGLNQLRLAETEKYAHVTFFFSGGREQPFTGEDRILIPSPKVATYDLQPEMSAVEVTDNLVRAITNQSHQLIICNYANGDMVGHTGKLSAAIKAVECIDLCLGRITNALNSSGAQCLITADHGNVEQLVDHEHNQPHTAHTSEHVPLVYVGPKNIALRQTSGLLSDVAPTILDLLNLPKPDEMTGTSLLVTDKN